MESHRGIIGAGTAGIMNHSKPPVSQVVNATAVEYNHTAPIVPPIGFHSINMLC